MRSMGLQTAGAILDAAEYLPSGASLVVHQCGWDDYERVLEGLIDRPGLQVCYDSGKLEIVSPLPEHEEYERLIEDLVLVFCEVSRVKLEKRGGATWKKRALDKGVEPDASFYIQNAKRVIGKRRIDLESDPPPDIVVEIDLTSSSLHKLPIYAALGIPEVWRYDGRTCRFYALAQGRYLDATVSQFLPRLTGEMLAAVIELSKTQGQDEARRAFRRQVKALRAAHPGRSSR